MLKEYFDILSQSLPTFFFLQKTTSRLICEKMHEKYSNYCQLCNTIVVFFLIRKCNER